MPHDQIEGLLTYQILRPLIHNGQDVIGVRYKQGAENWAPEEEIKESRDSRIRYPENLHPGKPYEIYVTDFSMKSPRLCDLLNGRITK